ncbi:hypothetical protein O7A61_30850, partial [Mesorhizobium sp. Cs1321R2N1]
DLTGELSMTTAKQLARYSAVEGALASGFATAELHHLWGRDQILLPVNNNLRQSRPPSETRAQNEFECAEERRASLTDFSFSAIARSGFDLCLGIAAAKCLPTRSLSCNFFRSNLTNISQ